MGLARTLTERFDLVILDLNLPKRDGLEVLAESAGKSAAPVIVLTARADLPTRLMAFQAGAVDYLAKPFFMAELVARIRSRLGAAADRRLVRWANAAVDLDARALTVEGVEVPLTPAEFGVLAYLGEPSRKGHLAADAGRRRAACRW